MSTPLTASSPATIPVLIVGGGPAGLTLARCLQRKGITVRVLERDRSRDARAQGGTLDLHEDSGQYAIRAMKLDAEFARLSRPEGQATRILNQDGTLLYEDLPAPDDFFRPEIARGDLRDLLLDSLTPGALEWDCQVVASERTGDTRRVVLSDGRAFTANLVVACDGAWSRLRPLLTEQVPVYSGITFVESGFAVTDATEDTAALVGNGTLFALGDGKGLFAQRNGAGYIRFYIAFAVGESWGQECQIDFADAPAVRAHLTALFADWSPTVRRLLEATEDRFVLRPLFKLSDYACWNTDPTLTLLGDAAHLMTPFAGQGANLALLDAAEFAACFLHTDGRISRDTLSAFETRMMERAAQAAAETQENQAICFGPDAATRLAQLFQQHHTR